MRDKILIGLQSYIRTRDNRLEKAGCWKKSPLQESWDALLNNKRLVKGGRTSCGKGTDITWTEFCFFNEIVRKANDIGYNIKVTSVTCKNSSPSRSGGFWNENLYEVV